MRPLVDLFVAVLRFLLPFFNKTTREKMGSALAVAVAIAAAVATYAPEIMQAMEPTPIVETAPAPQPAAPVAPLAQPVVDLDVTPSTPDGTSDDVAMGLDTSEP